MPPEPSFRPAAEMLRVKRREIPHYFLYGEDSQDVDERFLHVESIAERSRLHDWTIKPHAHRDLHHLLLIARGGGVFHAEGATHDFGAPCVITVPLACVHGFDFKPATDGWIVTASGTLLGRIRRDHPDLAPVVNDAAVIPLTSTSAAAIAPSFDSLAAEFRSNGPARRTAAESLLMVVLVSALRQKLQLSSGNAPARSLDSKLVSRYRVQLEEHYRKPMSIAEHAARLCVSQERLRLACVRTTGSSPLARSAS